MTRVFVLLMLVCLTMICSCQRRDSAGERREQRKAELQAREEELARKLDSLDQRMNSLDQRIKELAEKQNTEPNARTNPTDAQGQAVDPAEFEAEKERMLQQFSAMLPKPSQLNAAEKQRQLEAAGASPTGR